MYSVNDLELFSKVREGYKVIFKTGYQRQLSFVVHGPLVFCNIWEGKKENAKKRVVFNLSKHILAETSNPDQMNSR